MRSKLTEIVRGVLLAAILGLHTASFAMSGGAVSLSGNTHVSQLQPQPQPPLKGTIDGPVTVVDQPDPNENRRQAEQRAQTRFENTIQVITLIFVAVAAVAATAAYFANRRAANAAVRQVEIATSPRLYVDGLEAVNFERGKEPVFFLIIANAGPVQAESVQVFVEIQHAHGHTRPAQSNAILIPASGFRRYDFRSSFVLPNDLDELERWKLTLKGAVTHDERKIDFCYKYNHWFGERPTGVPLFVPCDFDVRRHVTVSVEPATITFTAPAATTRVDRGDGETESR
jgi:hypothetical protein